MLSKIIDLEVMKKGERRKKERIKIQEEKVKKIKVNNLSVYIKVVNGKIYISKFKNENFDMYKGNKLYIKEYGLNTQQYVVYI